ncbi:YheC/YheD family protein [Paenibacillus sp.]|uniref:YheC/YheD family endospore coat-associated protein n=1 Tax=Paenibacillus sp. TaxID=58172 RepID=UPI002D6135E9|nr:YheC/YheD family protein [Paenibacillus sp.]HZG86389.1 YheC/YheD family protein [Paenibacillus sp.]
MPANLKIVVDDGDVNRLTISPAIGGPHPEWIVVSFGVKTMSCRVRWTDANLFDGGDIVCRLPADVQAYLKIPLDLSYPYRWDGKTLTIGPTIGLLFGRNAGNYTSEFMEKHYADRMLAYPEFGGLVVAYSINAVDWTTQTVTGLYYHPVKKRWVACRTTLPKVTYRRHIGQPNIKAFREAVVRSGGIMFNTARFSKWEMHRIVGDNPILRQYIPPTIRVKNADRLYQFLKQHGSVIIKPVFSSRGKGIATLRRLDDGIRIIEYSVERRVGRLVEPEKLGEWLEAAYGRARRKPIAQKLIPIATVGGAVFDIRVVMQRNVRGEWASSGIECRVAATNKEISNLAAGGRAAAIEDAFRRMDAPVGDVAKLQEEIAYFCRQFCFWMDQLEGHRFVEYGIDLAVDRNGKLWFIEANFRPGYQGFRTFDEAAFRRISAQPLRYAAAVQGFAVTSPDQD